MRFTVDRASRGSVSEVKGVEIFGEYRYTYTDSQGMDHDEFDCTFCIEIDSSEQLKELIDSVGSIIISKGFDGIYHIQIYDDYVE